MRKIYGDKLEVVARRGRLLENCLELQRGQVNKSKNRLRKYTDMVLYRDNK